MRTCDTSTGERPQALVEMLDQARAIRSETDRLIRTLTETWPDIDLLRAECVDALVQLIGGVCELQRELTNVK